MTRPPQVSFLLPVRNGEPHLPLCLESLKRQVFESFEVVCVDDGSEDRTAEILARYQDQDSRFQVLRTSPQGLVSALNTGLARCRGELVARMDADDVSHPRRLELQVAALSADPELGVVSCRVRHFPWPRVREGLRIYEAWLNGLLDHDSILRERFIESPVAHPSALVRRSLLETVGGYEDREWPEDYDLWLRLARLGARFHKVDHVLYLWRDHPERLTWRDRRYSVESFLKCKAHHLAQGPLSNCPQVIMWGAGQTGRRLSRHLLRDGVPLTAFLDIDPKKQGRTLRSLAIHSPEALPDLLTRGSIVLSAVASRGARQLIRERLNEFGLTEGKDYWCVA